jgi:hypothetical protein
MPAADVVVAFKSPRELRELDSIGFNNLPVFITVSLCCEVAPSVELALGSRAFERIAETLGRRHKKALFSDKPREFLEIEISPKNGLWIVGLRKGRVLVDLGRHGSFNATGMQRDSVGFSFGISIR